MPWDIYHLRRVREGGVDGTRRGDQITSRGASHWKDRISFKMSRDGIATADVGTVAPTTCVALAVTASMVLSVY